MMTETCELCPEYRPNNVNSCHLLDIELMGSNRLLACIHNGWKETLISDARAAGNQRTLDFEAVA